MNINDIKGQKATKDKLVEIFEKQRSLMDKYEDIEDRNGLLQTRDIPVNIHDRKGQARLKDFFWRTTEELAESFEAFEMNDMEHYLEEVSDALHFFVEASILAGITPDMLCADSNVDALEYLFKANPSFAYNTNADYMFRFIYTLGLAANCLKNKPWKQSHMMTDENKFNILMVMAWGDFIALCDKVGFTADSLYDYYFRKNEVNKFRVRSGY